MMKFTYTKRRWLPYVLFAIDSVMFTLLLTNVIVYGDLMCAMAITAIAQWRHERAASEHYQKALSYVLSGAVMKAIQEQNPGLLKLPSQELQEAIDEHC